MAENTLENFPESATILLTRASG